MFDKLDAVGIDLTDVFKVLENEGVEKFEKSWKELLDETQAQLRRRRRNEPSRNPDQLWAMAKPAAGQARQADAANRRAVRGGDLRRHRRPGPQEADAGDLRPGQPRSAAADLRAGGFRPARLGRRGLRRGSFSDAVKEHARTPFRQEVWDRLAEGFRFVQGTFDDDDAFGRLAETLDKLDAERGTGGNHAFYLSIPPKAFPVVCEQLHEVRAGPTRRTAAGAGWSSRSRSATTWRAPASSTSVVNSVFPEESVFRIDHYLGKETVQNILALRFANQLFDPIWNAHYVDHVQITMAEDIGLGGRGGYYDGIGAARDVIQNHLMQLLALTAMEEPVSFTRRAAGREDQGALRDPAGGAARRDHRRGPVHRGLAGRREGRRAARRGGLLQGLDHRDVRRHHARGGHPPLGRGAVLPAHRKTAGPQGDRDRAGVQAGAASAVRRDHDRGAGHERPGDPGAARRGHHDAVRVQGARQPWKSATSTWTSPTARRSPRSLPRPTSG